MKDLVPDRVGVITGYRGWVSQSNNGMVAIYSYNGMIWSPGEKLRAGCIYHHENGGHRSPNDDCTCGIYALSSPQKVFDALIPYQNIIFGEVALWGKIIKGANGYRAEYAYPQRFVVISHMLMSLDEMIETNERGWARFEQLADMYGVELHFVGRGQPWPAFGDIPAVMDKNRSWSNPQMLTPTVMLNKRVEAGVSGWRPGYPMMIKTGYPVMTKSSILWKMQQQPIQNVVVASIRARELAQQKKVRRQRVTISGNKWMPWLREKMKRHR